MRQEFIFFRQTQQTYKDSYLLTLLLKIKNWLHVSAFLSCPEDGRNAETCSQFLIFNSKVNK
jgi:hypothetical protein